MKKFNIVYQIINKINGKIYIGCHQTDNLYDKYMGSGRILHRAFKKYGIENFTKIILENFNTPKEMFKKEKELVNEDFIRRKDTYNISEGGVKPPGTKGKVIVINEIGEPICISKNDPRFLSGELKGVCAGKVLVKDKNGNALRVDTNDTRYISGELISAATGFIAVKDVYNNYFSLDKNNYDKSKYKFIWTGRRHTKESKRKIGMANSIHQKGERNNRYGTCWIYNIELKKSKSIKKEELQQWLDKGWKSGRKLYFIS
jgi:hypothetical protein